jgi:hypothetical protein
MSCRHDLALGTCRECYPSTGTVVPSGPGFSMDGPGATPRPPEESSATPVGQPCGTTRKVKVRCTFVIEVEVPDRPDYDAQWDLEENHCAGTGSTGAAFDEVYKQQEKNGCWACALHCENKIVEEPNQENQLAQGGEESSATPGVQDETLRCHFCHEPVDLETGFIEFYDKCTDGAEPQPELLVYPSKGQALVSNLEWHSYERIAVFSHKGCGPDCGYWFSLYRLGEDWEWHLSRKRWWWPGGVEALRLARRVLGMSTSVPDPERLDWERYSKPRVP